MRDSLELDNRAAEARSILNNSLYQEVLEKMRKDFTAKMLETAVGSKEAVEAHAMLKVLDEFQKNFESIITDQKMAFQRKVSYGR